MRIENNLSALFAQNNLQANNVNLSKSLEILSSGNRINRTSDDAAGLQISSKMRAQVRAFDTPIRNAQDGISILQTAEGGMGKVQSMLERMRELATQAANGSESDSDRQSLQREMSALFDEIDRTSTIAFGSTNLLDGSANDLTIQIGNSVSEKETLPTLNVQTSALGLTKDNTNITTRVGAENSITLIDKAFDIVSAQRASVGSIQGRLDLETEKFFLKVNEQSAAKTRINDVDFAQESAAMIRNQILTQAGTSILSHANQSPHGVLQLLR